MSEPPGANAYVLGATRDVNNVGEVCAVIYYYLDLN
jgi:hypothetical protein